MDTRYLRFLFCYILLFCFSATAGIKSFPAYVEASKILEEGAYQKALPVLEKVVYDEQYEPQRALHKFGIEFGWFWYQKGVCEGALADWASAKISYKTCYSNFAVKRSREAPCYYNTYALFKWAEACYVLQEYDEAFALLKKFEKVLKVTPLPASDYPSGKLSVYLASVALKLGAEGGEQYVEQVMRQGALSKVPMMEVLRVFNALIEVCLKAKKIEFLLHVLTSYKEVLESDIFALCGASKLLLSRVSELVEHEETAAAYAVLRLVPCSQTVLNDLYSYRNRIVQFGDYTSDKTLFSGESLERTKSLIRNLEGDLRSRESNDAMVLTLRAKIWSQYKNLPIAYQCYSLLEAEYSQHKDREDNLYQLIFLSQKLGKLDVLQDNVKLFIREFSESHYLERIIRLAVEELYTRAKYTEVIELVNDVISTIAPDYTLNQMLLYALGASYYYTESYETSVHFLQQYQMNAEEQERGVEVRFMNSSNFLYLGQYNEAQQEIDAFYGLLEIKPEEGFARSKTELVPYVLLNQLAIYKQAEKHERMKEIFERLDNKETPSEIVSKACNMMGDAYVNMGQIEDATRLYKRAFQSAVDINNEGEKAHALINLVQLATAVPSPSARLIKLATRSYDQYWESFSEYEESLLVAADGYKLLKRQNKEKLGLRRILHVLLSSHSREGLLRAEPLTYLYCKEYARVYDMKRLEAHIENVVDVEGLDLLQRSFFQTGFIKVYEKHLPKKVLTKASQEFYKNEVVIRFFEELLQLKDFNLLTSEVLIQLGYYTLYQTSTQTEALKYFEEVSKREEVGLQQRALLGIAQLYRRSESIEDRLKCEKLLRRVYTDENCEDPEEVLFIMIQFLVERERWSEVSIKAGEYLQNTDYEKYMKQVQLFSGLSSEKQNKPSEAINSYAKCRTHSADATLRLMKLVWQRDLNETTLSGFKGKGRDRLVAIMIGKEYLAQSPPSSDEKSQIQRLLREYQKQLSKE